MFKKGNRANTLHGILLIALFSFAAFYIAEIPFVKSLSFSPLIVGIILGMLYANSLRNKLPETWVPGIKFCTKQVLRAGIVLYGFRLTLTQVAAVGLPAVVIDTIIVAGTIFLGIWLGKLMKMDKDTSLMTATGSAICGAAAVLGAEPVVKCEGHKTAIAVSTVVIFGTISMFLYPIMYRAGMLDALGDTGVAIYTGSTLHEVAHVAGAGNAMDPTDSLGIAGTATITKMIRVMMLAPVLVIMSFALAGRKKANPEGKAEKSKITIPWFAFGFIGIICLNSLLQYLTGAETVKDIPLNGAIEYIDTFMLTMAMTALGTDTSLEKFKQAGAKPFLLAGLLYIWLKIVLRNNKGRRKQIHLPLLFLHVPILLGRHARIAFEIFSEKRNIREIQRIGYFLYGHVRRTELGLRIAYDKRRKYVGQRFSGYFLHRCTQVLWRKMQFLGIERHIAFCLIILHNNPQQLFHNLLVPVIPWRIIISPLFIHTS